MLYNCGFLIDFLVEIVRLIIERILTMLSIKTRMTNTVIFHSNFQK